MWPAETLPSLGLAARRPAVTIPARGSASTLDIVWHPKAHDDSTSWQRRYNDSQVPGHPYVSGSVQAYRVDSYISSYSNTTSDHFPVLSRYNW